MNLSQLVLHIEAPHAEDIGERVSEQSFDRNTLELCASALAKTIIKMPLPAPFQ